MTKLNEVFANKKAFIAFVVAGDPDFAACADNIVALAEAGADLVEIGIPFSDPVADGSVIQAADLRAFAAGSTTAKVFELVAEVRKRTQVPLVFLTYCNLVYQYGYDEFFTRCAELAISGAIIPDLPLEERDEVKPIAEAHGCQIIPLVTPTTPPERIAQIVADVDGFIYVVSSMGITGTRDTINTDLDQLIANIRKYTTTPTAIGFGIHTPEQAAQMGAIADGVIVGSAIVDIIGQYGHEAPAHLQAYVKAMRAALPA